MIRIALLLLVLALACGGPACVLRAEQTRSWLGGTVSYWVEVCP